MSAASFPDSPIARLVVDVASGRIVEGNRALAEMAGVSAEMLSCLAIQDLLWECRHEGTEQWLAHLRDTWSGLRAQTLLRGGDAPLLVDVIAEQPPGQPEGRLALELHDVTGSRDLATAFEISVEPMLVMDRNGFLLEVNAAFEQLTGFERGELKGRTLELLDSGHHGALFWDELWATLRQGLTWRGPVIYRHKDGRPFTWDMVFTSLKGADGAVIHYVGVARDTSLEENLRQQLVQAQKIHAVGQMTGGIAHDFNNLLTTILGLGHLMRDELPEGTTARTDLEEILGAAERGSTLTRRLLMFSSAQTAEPQVIDLNALIVSLQKLVARVIGENIDLYSIHSVGPATVLADPGQIEQVLMNLVVNARDAMPEGGSLKIQVQRADLPLEKAAELSIDPGPFVIVSVADTGTGISTEMLSRIFEPFFTTKEPGRGTGLGLVTSRAIVEQAGGALAVESEEGKGSTFRVYLPYVEGSSDMIALPGGTVERGTETVLVAEDEDTVREMTVRILRRLGYQVLEAPNGEKALAVLEREKRSVDLLVSDIIMPRMDGRQLAERLRRDNPRLPIVFVSGYSAGEDVNGLKDESTDFIQKPFRPYDLAQRVRRLLDRARRG